MLGAALTGFEPRNGWHACRCICTVVALIVGVAFATADVTSAQMATNPYLSPTQRSEQALVQAVGSPFPAQKLEQGSETIRPAGGEALLGPVMPAPGAEATDEVPPFGSQLFSQNAALIRSHSVNPSYVIASGDQISIQVWGAQNYTGTQAVDPSGNIFVPEIGPVRVAGYTAANVNTLVAGAVRRVFTSNVNAYVTVLSRQPVGVYVAGAVRVPGHYAGEANASPLSFIAQAGGVAPGSGSYRDIRILRDGNQVAHIDLYAFLLSGTIPTLQFRENDTIFVGLQGPTVKVHGEAQNLFRFEVAVDRITGADIVNLGRPQASVSHVSVKGVRNNQPFNAYMSLADFASAQVHNGDDVTFVTDRVNETIVVSVVGQSGGPSSFTVPRGARLGDVLRLIEVAPELTDLAAIYLRRASVAERQTRALEMALNELQRTALTSSSTTSTEAAMRSQEASLVERFVAKARTVRPEGRVVLAGTPDRDDLRLEDLDTIVLPDKSQVVMVAGEVRVPQTLMWRSDLSIEQYVELAGGYSSRAAREDYVVIRRNGQAVIGSVVDVQPGDQVMVMPSAGDKGFAIFHDLIEVLYRVAVSSAVVINAMKD